MIIQVNLKDTDCCQGCPCIGVSSFKLRKHRCNLGYWDEFGCRIVAPIERKRSAACIKKNGK